MVRLASSIENMQSDYEVIVIGSGYGGSISASRMARAGRKVCLLERGKEFQPGEYPDTLAEAVEELQMDSPQGHVGSATGLYDIRVNNDMDVVQGCGLGGTSLINANVGLEVEPRVFEDIRWPKLLLNDLENVHKGYSLAKDMLKARPQPDTMNSAKTRLMKMVGEKWGKNEYKTPLYVNFEEKVNHVGVHQKACNGCGDCVSGCNVSAKNTMIMNYLPDAVNHGAEIYTQVGVSHLSHKNGKWTVHYSLLKEGQEKFDAPELFVTADIVIVAAGTLGSTEILLRSKEKGLPLSDVVGERFTGNGDFLGFSYNGDYKSNSLGMGTRTPDPEEPIGPCISSVIDLRNQEKVSDGMVIEEGSTPGALAQIYVSGLNMMAKTGEDTDSGLLDKVSEKKRELDSVIRGPYHGAIAHSMTYLVMTHDDGKGRMYLKDNRLRIDWEGVGREKIFEKVNANLRKVAEHLGGTYMSNPVWSNVMGKDLVTVHPLGGCIMGDNIKEGVVNHKGQVFSGESTDAVYEGLYVNDGAIVPMPLGVNPSFTISALAERNSYYMAADRNWQIDYEFKPIAQNKMNDKKPGVQFTEKMKGFLVWNDGNTDYKTTYEQGKDANQNAEFVLTIVSEDVEDMVKNAGHQARMTGTFNAPLLSASPFTVHQGIFNLFCEDESAVNTKLMKYSMPLVSEEGKEYFFYGYKVAHNNAEFDAWSDTSTLYITIHQGKDASAPVVAKGILKIAPADFMKQMTTMKALNVSSNADRLKYLAMFGSYFAKSMYEVYGGIAAKQNLFNPEAAPRKKRTLRAPAPEIHSVMTADNVELRLTRYNAGNKGTVMLSHGMGVSGKMYCIDTIDTNMLEYLCAHEYDVWVQDWRGSIELAASETQFTADEVAKYDHAACIEKILAVTGKKGIHVVAHCVGAITMTMALLSGMKGVDSFLVSQVSTHPIVGLTNKIKAKLHLPDLMDSLGIDFMNTYTDSHASWKDRIANQLLRLYPQKLDDYSADPVSSRISFVYGNLWKLDNLNQPTFDALHELFGIANIDMLKQLTLMAREEVLKNANNEDVYLPNLAENLNIPITFLHGTENVCFVPEGTEKTMETLKSAFPSGNFERHLIEGYGHIDCIFGKNAVEDVYPHILTHLNRVTQEA